MKITVLGCGALGQLWLAALHQQGHDVQGWMRFPAPYRAVNVQMLDGKLCNLTLQTNDPEHLMQSKLLLVTLKAWQVSDAVSALLPTIAPDCTILLLHNGMGTREELPVLTQPLLQGVTPHDAMRRWWCTLPEEPRTLVPLPAATAVARFLTAIRTLRWLHCCIRRCRMSRLVQ